MKLHSIPELALVAAVLAAGCTGDKTPPPPPATVAAQPAGAAPVVAAGDFGVPACDQYMRKYMACVDSKVPQSGKAVMRQSMEQTKAAWKQAAVSAQGREGLAMACAQAEAAARQ